MAVPTYDELGDPGLEMVRIASERVGQVYTGSIPFAGQSDPISLKDLSALAGGQAGGSGNSYPAINLLNPVGPTFNLNRRPDGSNPLKMSEFFGYDQLLTRRVVRFAGPSVTSAAACGTAMSLTYYYHDGSGTYPVGGDKIYTATTGTAVAAAGFYQLFDPDTGVSDDTWVEVIGGGGGFAGTVTDSGSCPP